MTDRARRRGSRLSGQVPVIGLVPTATQLGFAVGLLCSQSGRPLFVTGGDSSCFNWQHSPCRWPLLVSLPTLGGSWLHRPLRGASSVARRIRAFRGRVGRAPPWRVPAVAIVMASSAASCLAASLPAPVGDHYGWRAMFWLGLSRRGGLVVGGSCLPGSWRKRLEGYGTCRILSPPTCLWQEEPELRRGGYCIQVVCFQLFSVLWTIVPGAAAQRPTPPGAVAVGVLFGPYWPEKSRPERCRYRHQDLAASCRAHLGVVLS